MVTIKEGLSPDSVDDLANDEDESKSPFETYALPLEPCMKNLEMDLMGKE